MSAISGSRTLGDLVDAGEGSAALLQVVVARVDVGALGKRGVVMPRPLADDGDGHARVLHQGQGRVPGVVQGDPAQARALEQPPELVGVLLGVHRHSQHGPGEAVDSQVGNPWLYASIET